MSASFTPEQVMAYVDGELDAVTVKRIERALPDDPALAAEIDAQRRLRGLLATRFDPVLDEPVPEQLTKPLETVDTSLTERREMKRKFFAPLQVGAMAAALALGLFFGVQLDNRGLVAERGGALVAQGELDDALDVQLASNQEARSDVRIGLTFRDGSGTYCRSFEASSVSGIACREGGEWQLRRTFGGVAATEYRQASSGELAEAVERMMGPEGPLDAEGEVRARDLEWRGE